MPAQPVPKPVTYCEIDRVVASQKALPEACSQLPYVLLWTVGMAPTCYGRVFPAIPLQKETILNRCQFHGRRAFFVVVTYVIDTSTYATAPHQPGIVGQIGGRTHIPHARIEPQVVAIWIENHWHAVMDGCGHSVWGRGQNRAGLYLRGALTCTYVAATKTTQKRNLTMSEPQPLV